MAYMLSFIKHNLKILKRLLKTINETENSSTAFKATYFFGGSKNRAISNVTKEIAYFYLTFTNLRFFLTEYARNFG